MDDIDDEDDVEFVTGPYCQHWSDPSECDEVCICGHTCKDHSYWGDDRMCVIEECSCEKFVDKEED